MYICDSIFLKWCYNNHEFFCLRQSVFVGVTTNEVCVHTIYLAISYLKTWTEMSNTEVLPVSCVKSNLGLSLYGKNT